MDSSVLIQGWLLTQKTLMPNITSKDFSKLTIHESLKKKEKKEDLKVVYKLQLEGEELYCRIVK